MRRLRIEDMVGGWFVGDFEPAAFRTRGAEAALKQHHAGEPWPAHYHAVATEINLVISGQMTVNDVVVGQGDIFVIDPGEAVTPVFLTDCELVVVKVPSVPGDKYSVA